MKAPRLTVADLPSLYKQREEMQATISRLEAKRVKQSGIEVHLKDSAFRTILSTTPDAKGYYELVVPRAGHYCVWVTKRGGVHQLARKFQKFATNTKIVARVEL